MRVDNTLSNREVWELHNKTNRTSEEIDAYWDARRENPTLDRALYDYDVAEYYKEFSKAETILKRLILTGDVSEEELNEAKKEDPTLFEQSLIVKEEIDELKKSIAEVDEKKEKQKLLAESMVEVNKSSNNNYRKLKSIAINDLKSRV